MKQRKVVDDIYDCIKQQEDIGWAGSSFLLPARFHQCGFEVML